MRQRTLPVHVQREFEDYLKCGRLEHGFLRVRCADCHAERLVAFSCKRRGFCPSCGARQMAEGAALLVDKVLPREPLCGNRARFVFEGSVRGKYRARSPVLGISYPGNFQTNKALLE